MSEKDLPVALSIPSPTTVFNFHFDWLRHFQGFALNYFYLNKICEHKKYFELSSNFLVESMVTPFRTPGISGLKSQILKPTFLS